MNMDVSKYLLEPLVVLGWTPARTCKVPPQSVVQWPFFPQTQPLPWSHDAVLTSSAKHEEVAHSSSLAFKGKGTETSHLEQGCETSCFKNPAVLNP